jgi:hypothetical protein
MKKLFKFRVPMLNMFGYVIAKDEDEAKTMLAKTSEEDEDNGSLKEDSFLLTEVDMTQSGIILTSNSI